MTSQLKVDRISPANTSEIIIDGLEAGIPEAPINGNIYGRIDGNWQIVTTGALINETRHGSGTITVPQFARNAEIFVSGGGGGGANHGNGSHNRAGGGQGYQLRTYIDVNQYETMNAVVGAAGTYNGMASGGPGGQTTLTYKDLSITCGGGGGGVSGAGSGAGGGAAGVGNFSDPSGISVSHEGRSAMGSHAQVGEPNNSGLIDPQNGSGGNSYDQGSIGPGSIYIKWYG